MFCSRCGSEALERAKYCSNCGLFLSITPGSFTKSTASVGFEEFKRRKEDERRSKFEPKSKYEKKGSTSGSGEVVPKSYQREGQPRKTEN